MQETIDTELREVYEWVVYVLTYQVPLSADGSMRISVKSLILGLFVVLLAWQVSRGVQRLLRRRVLTHLALDAGLSYTLQQMVHYLVLGIGFLFALYVALGINFTSLAVVVTALSVGIGLGLREITSDVAAGFVLLFERPIRVGDRVKLSSDLNVEGDVVAIGLRTTKIVTNDRLTLIVPNSKLANEEYVNWSYTNEPVRLHVPVGVAYGSDVEVVRRALLAAVKGVDRVVPEPKPSVRLVGFGESALDFELLVWTREPEKHPQIRSDLNFNIEREFRAANVSIPFPQQEVYVHMAE